MGGVGGGCVSFAKVAMSKLSLVGYIRFGWRRWVASELCQGCGGRSGGGGGTWCLWALWPFMLSRSKTFHGHYDTGLAFVGGWSIARNCVSTRIVGVQSVYPPRFLL